MFWRDWRIWREKHTGDDFLKNDPYKHFIRWQWSLIQNSALWIYHQNKKEHKNIQSLFYTKVLNLLQLWNTDIRGLLPYISQFHKLFQTLQCSQHMCKNLPQLQTLMEMSLQITKLIYKIDNKYNLNQRLKFH